MENAAEIGSYMMDRLREMKDESRIIVDVRGLGLMIGIEIVRDRETLEPWAELRDNVVLECFNRGLVLQGAGESVDSVLASFDNRPRTSRLCDCDTLEV